MSLALYVNMSRDNFGCVLVRYKYKLNLFKTTPPCKPFWFNVVSFTFINFIKVKYLEKNKHVTFLLITVFEYKRRRRMKS